MLLTSSLVAGLSRFVVMQGNNIANTLIEGSRYVDVLAEDVRPSQLTLQDNEICLLDI